MFQLILMELSPMIMMAALLMVCESMEQEMWQGELKPRPVLGQFVWFDEFDDNMGE